MTNIVVAIDNKSIGYIKPLLNSIYKNIKEPFIYILTDGPIDILDENIKKITNIIIVDSNLINIDGPYKRITKHTYYRCFLDLLIPNIKKCIYLDWDIIVLKDISNLLLDDNFLIKGVSINNNNYINAGVLAFNFTNECKECMNKVRNRIGYSPDDQDCINIGFDGKKTIISNEYNCMIGCLEPNDETKIIHFLGPVKPWHMHPSIKYWLKYNE